MTDRFTEDTAASYTAVGLPAKEIRELRRRAEERAYGRWEIELRRKYRSVRTSSSGLGDEVWLETIAKPEDHTRLRELVAEELANSGV